MTVQDYKVCYQVLKKVLLGHAYINIALDSAIKANSECNTQSITFLCYGIIEKNNILKNLLDNLVSRKSKPSIEIILKIGVFAIKYMNIPNNSVVNNVVSMTKEIGKEGVCGFVNAVLRKSVEYSGVENNQRYPQWVIDILLKDYSQELVAGLIEYCSTHLTHIRPNLFKIDDLRFSEVIDGIIIDNQKAKANPTALGYFVNGVVLNKLDRGTFTAQSYGSMLVVECVGRNNNYSILDLCAAPGGKSIYVLQNNPKSTIISCDLHAHRVCLIKDYANRMGTKLDILKNDAMLINSQWINRFDLVMCDVPCSGLGVAFEKPDIMANITKESIKELNKIQRTILDNASKYVKVNGKILYSSCTYFNSENEDIIMEFLENNSNYKKQEVDNKYVKSDKNAYVKIAPHTHGTEGFFACVLVRIN